MNQVQIRQIPARTQPMAGLWFPTGYYGHFRAKSRGDLCNQFRQLARPNPPRKFLYRHNSEAGSHIFSQHDNRFKFENDPLVRCTQAGFGKRRAQSNARGEFDPYFIGWRPGNTDQKDFTDTINTTSYTDDYNGNFTSSQMLTDIPTINSSPVSEGSVYSSVYNHGQPDHEQAKQIRQETFQRYLTTQTRRSQLQQTDRSVNVASCLVWNSTETDKNTKINDNSKNILAPISIKSRHSFNAMPSIHTPKLNHSQSMKTLKSIDEPSFDPNTLEKRYNFTTAPTPRLASSLDQTHTNSVECLISKYM